jgi:hypothetical protein
MEDDGTREITMRKEQWNVLEHDGTLWFCPEKSRRKKNEI